MGNQVISITASKGWDKTFQFLKEVPTKLSLDGVIEKYGNMGVEQLKNFTPVDTGKTANSWYYDVDKTPNTVTINFKNSNIVDGHNVAILIQYGHGTKNGGYVVGRDYINPALKPVFDDMADSVWKEISRS